MVSYKVVNPLGWCKIKHSTKNRIHLILFLAISFFIFSGTAFADIENGLLVTEILYGNEIHAKDKVPIRVGVVNVSVNEGTNGGGLSQAKPADEAVVKVTLIKGQQQIETSLASAGEGKYRGFVTFPEPGSWKIVAVAEDKALHEHKDADAHSHGEPGQNMLEAKVEVLPASQKILYIGASLVLASAVVWFLVRKRKNRV